MLYLSTQGQASYHTASLGPSAYCPSSDFDNNTEETNLCTNVDITAGHAVVHAKAVMTDDDRDNDNDANDSDFPHTLGEILGATFMASQALTHTKEVLAAERYTRIHIHKHTLTRTHAHIHTPTDTRRHTFFRSLALSHSFSFTSSFLSLSLARARSRSRARSLCLSLPRTTRLCVRNVFIPILSKNMK